MPLNLHFSLHKLDLLFAVDLYNFIFGHFPVLLSLDLCLCEPWECIADIFWNLGQIMALLDRLDVPVVNEIALHQSMHLSLIKRPAADLEKVFEPLSLLEALDIKFKFLLPEVGLDHVRVRVQSHSWEESIFGDVDVTEGYIQKCSILSVKYFFFINEEATAYYI